MLIPMLVWYYLLGVMLVRVPFHLTESLEELIEFIKLFSEISDGFIKFLLKHLFVF